MSRVAVGMLCRMLAGFVFETDVNDFGGCFPSGVAAVRKRGIVSHREDIAYSIEGVVVVHDGLAAAVHASLLRRRWLS